MLLAARRHWPARNFPRRRPCTAGAAPPLPARPVNFPKTMCTQRAGRARPPRPAQRPVPPAPSAAGPAAAPGPGKQPLWAGRQPPRPPHTPCHGALPGVRDGPLAGEGSYQPENPEPGLLSPRGSPPTSPGRPPGKTPGARRWMPATPAQCGSQPRDSARFEQHRVRVLTWRKAWRESFRRTATAAMATAPWAKGRRWGTAEA